MHISEEQHRLLPQSPNTNEKIVQFDKQSYLNFFFYSHLRAWQVFIFDWYQLQHVLFKSEHNFSHDLLKGLF